LGRSKEITGGKMPNFGDEERQTYATKDKLFVLDSGELRELAERVIEEAGIEALQNIDLDQIGFVVVEGDSGDYLGKAIKVPPLYRLFLKKHFLILFNATRIEATSPGKYDMIMLHELVHCNTEYDLIRDHDVEDFSWMIRKFGIDWATDTENRVIPEADLFELVPWADTKSTPAERAERRQGVQVQQFAITQDDVVAPAKKAKDMDVESEEHVTKAPKSKTKAVAKIPPSNIQQRIAKAFSRPTDEA
jgi:hypothetical protein